MESITNRNIKIAVVGAGYMGQNHIKILSSLPDANLVAVCDIDKQKTKRLAKQYKIREYDDFYSLVQKEKLDAISICLPTSLHYETSYECIRRKIPVFVEKPVCATVSQAKKLRFFAHKFKMPIMVGHIERFNPVVNEIKLRIKSGELGKIIKIHTQRFSPPVSTPSDVSVIVDLATHDIDIMQYILDDKIIRIFAETESNLHQKEDLMSAILRFKKGTIALIEVSWLYPTKERNLYILGENGMYRANYLTQELFFYRQNKLMLKSHFEPFTSLTNADVVKIAFQSREPLYLELRAFIDALNNHSKMPITIYDGLFSLDLAEKIARSGASNKVFRPKI